MIIMIVFEMHFTFNPPVVTFRIKRQWAIVWVRKMLMKIGCVICKTKDKLNTYEISIKYILVE